MMNKSAIICDIKGIQCDSKTCDYEDLEAKFEPEKWLNKPCPLCGSNLFTEEAYNQLQDMLEIINKVNGLVEKTGIDLTNEDYVNMEVLHDDKGLMNGVKILDKEDK